ncbi:hypothetical protein OCK74_09820 [Chitinophagaceae bacterium LB-8]|jgi:hypothetical protein|uniref:FAS1 domain-containing protein n=1 Tax=Paraflavisolibacter caeni TaxID=2982496 RepID=A0A9X3BHD8_9BACT|nr:hypothetical protein [Paraflavisolibacter caeni]MCU7549412.1 hypothetical protein [Paraflavisolibacter caeni]
MNFIKKIQVFALIAALLFMVGCQKDGYFMDTGKQTATFNGTILDYIKSKPGTWDSINKIVKLAGLEDSLKTKKLTFFLPDDSCVRRTLVALNQRLERDGKPWVTKLEQIDSAVWRRQLSRYLFKSAKSMNDFPQLDPGNLSAYQGQIYESYAGALMNIGVIYNDAGGVKYAGYHQLRLSYIPSISTPLDYNSWYSVTVSTVNVTPSNGFVHILNYAYHNFGFETTQFIDDVIDKGIDYTK